MHFNSYTKFYHKQLWKNVSQSICILDSLMHDLESLNIEKKQTVDDIIDRNIELGKKISVITN